MRATSTIVKALGHHRYIIHDGELMTLTVPTRLRKEGIDVYVGDNVLIDTDKQTVTEVLPRVNMLNKPKVANVEQALVLVSVTHPTPDLQHLDRVLCTLGISLNVMPILCLSKADLLDQHTIDQTFKVYTDLNYKILQISIIKQTGITELLETLKDKTTVLIGRSGVGKSSLLNFLTGQNTARIGDLSRRTNTGTHTTRHIQMYPLSVGSNDLRLVDIPGFNRVNIEFTRQDIIDHKPLPEMQNDEPCRYADCLHIGESGCRVQFAQSRQEHYRQIVADAGEFEEQMYIARKNSVGHKYTANKRIPMLDSKHRNKSI